MIAVRGLDRAGDARAIDRAQVRGVLDEQLGEALCKVGSAGATAGGGALGASSARAATRSLDHDGLERGIVAAGARRRPRAGRGA